MIKHILTGVLILFFFIGCTEEIEVENHPDGWLDVNSDFSHMKKISVRGIEFCRECHGGSDQDDYYGGIAGVSCYSLDCHAGGPSGHPVWSEWMNSTSIDFHGTERLADRGKPITEDQRCSMCHDYYHATEVSNRGDNSVGVYCTDCHTNDAENPGQKILVDCTTCHISQ